MHKIIINILAKNNIYKQINRGYNKDTVEIVLQIRKTLKRRITMKKKVLAAFLAATMVV